MSYEIKQFVREIERQIKEEGLLGISGVRFDRGGTPLDVLRSKQIGLQAMEGKNVSLHDIALEMNALNRAIANGEGEPLVFNDSSRFSNDDPRNGCDGCCDFDVCWPNEEAVEKSREAQKIIMKNVAKAYE